MDTLLKSHNSKTQEVNMGGTRKKYSQQFKIDAVKIILDQGHKASEAARNLEIHISLLQK